jgi:hypothetical protein
MQNAEKEKLSTTSITVPQTEKQLGEDRTRNLFFIMTLASKPWNFLC